MYIVTYFIAIHCKEILVSAPEDGRIIAPKHVGTMNKDLMHKIRE
jgi:hypothetical protein